MLPPQGLEKQPARLPPTLSNPRGDTMRINQLTVWVALALGTMSAQSAVTDKMIEDDAKTPGDIVSWGIGQQGQRYSPLKQINAQTIGKLVPAWSFSFGGEKQRGQESQPLIHD